MNHKGIETKGEISVAKCCLVQPSLSFYVLKKTSLLQTAQTKLLGSYGHFFVPLSLEADLPLH